MSDTIADTQMILLRAIIANPDDDAPRLAYADWLDENDGMMRCPAMCINGWVLRRGEIGADFCRECEGPICTTAGTVPNNYAKRAEFIRLQIKIHRWNTTEVRDAPYEEYLRWVSRVKELGELEAIRRQFSYGPLPISYNAWPYNGVCVRRGFVDSVNCSISDWLRPKVGPKISKMEPIEKIELNDRVPQPVNGQRIWRLDSSVIVPSQHTLPLCVFKLLKTGSLRTGFQQGDSAMAYPSTGHAIIDVSNACIEWAKTAWADSSS